ncbi:biopolymer transport protein ExbD [Mucilaginibacter sp. OAE612]|uniref:ExbD/TolR family protein n=1 Tax=Mucilaginibacter sp. OAE612 TaxID=3156444 RepID=UPI00359DCE3E
MYRPKFRRKHFDVDMFPMFNLLLIVLSFLMLSGRPAIRYPILINLPTGSSFNTADPDSYFTITTILIGQKKLMLKLDAPDIREATLKQIGNKYNTDFTPAEINKFGETDVIGTPLAQIKKYISGYYNATDYYNQPGLRLDELAEWIKESRKATFEKHNSLTRIFIMADGETPYPEIKNVIDMLGQQKITKFSIIYSYLRQI